jgi:hypothetical protein
MYQGGCQSSCPAAMYASSATCFSCTSPCYNCTGPTTCSSCNSGYLLVASSQCILGTNCPSGYYLIPNSSNCSSSCPIGLYK